VIKAKNINKSYGNFQVLRDINIELNPGEVTILFGPSGCGKTTLVRNLSLLDLPDSGELKIFDREYKFPLKTNRKLILPFPKLTMVFQQLFLWPHLKNKENILLALDKNQDDYEKSIEYYDYLIEGMEMKDYIDKFPNESSLGQKQRVAIARALILNPDFIFFDEITASLDIIQINHILKLIMHLRNSTMGFLFITHDIDIAKKIGDKLIFMQNGEIIEVGHKDILTQPKTKELINFLNLF
jgi:ABC-type polar amino acid transport system ATPase subunit